MSALDRIAVRVVNPADAPTGNARALLRELLVLLEAWVARGEAASIDLRSLPLSPGDYAELRTALGEGAVSARIEAMGPTEVRESRYPGVWWVTHRNAANDVVAELIEVCDVPALLRSPPEDAAAGLERFRIARDSTIQEVRP
jgi:hydrogenase-1 operon protein HyaF